MKEFQIISAPFASGLAWLINILLELDVRCTHVSTNKDGTHWGPGDEGRIRIGDYSFAHLRWHLPVLRERREFTFREPIEVFWEHRLDLARHVHRPTLLYVRDPRDAIYSLYRRDYAHSLSFEDYLRRPDIWPDHFPDMFQLPPPETWACFHWFWMHLSPLPPVQAMTFESMRAEPVARIEEVLRFLGVDRTRAEIESALAASTFERARQTMVELEQQTGRNFLTARRGKVGEWKETYSEEALRCFDGPANEVMRIFGYVPAPAKGDSDGVSASRAFGPSSDAGVIDEIHKSRNMLEAGGGPRVIENLEHAVQIAPHDGPSQVSLAALRTAVKWTCRIASGTPANPASGVAVFDSLHGFVERFREEPAIRQCVLAMENSGLAPRAGREPQLLEAGVNGFNLVAYGGRYIALSQSAGAVDLTAAGPQVLDGLRARGALLESESLSNLKRLLSTSPKARRTP